MRRCVAMPNSTTYLSSLTIAEFVGVLQRLVRTGTLRKSSVEQLYKRVRRDIGTTYRPFRVVDWSAQTFIEANRILLQYAGRHAIGTNDGMHLAIACLAARTLDGLTLVTSDRAMQAICDKLKLPFVDPETKE